MNRSNGFKSLTISYFIMSAKNIMSKTVHTPLVAR